MTSSAKTPLKKKTLKRLHKIIANAGVCSLREAEKLIGAGSVAVNGKIVTTKGASADPENDSIYVDGKEVTVKISPMYLAMYKPKGYVSTRSDEKGRKVVMDLLPPNYRNLYPVGRLDIMSEGLLLFTNDGMFAQSVLAPKNKIEKVYMVKVRNIPDPKKIKKIMTGVTREGYKLKAESVSLVEVTGKNCWLEVTLTEGKKQHIRRLLTALGHPVLKLRRISIGPVTLGKLRPGESVHLKKEKVNKLMKMAGR